MATPANKMLPAAAMLIVVLEIWGKTSIAIFTFNLVWSTIIMIYSGVMAVIWALVSAVVYAIWGVYACVAFLVGSVYAVVLALLHITLLLLQMLLYLAAVAAIGFTVWFVATYQTRERIEIDESLETIKRRIDDTKDEMEDYVDNSVRRTEGRFRREQRLRDQETEENNMIFAQSLMSLQTLMTSQKENLENYIDYKVEASETKSLRERQRQDEKMNRWRREIDSNHFESLSMVNRLQIEDAERRRRAVAARPKPKPNGCPLS